jgi:SAM-dependent methyltransferase
MDRLDAYWDGGYKNIEGWVDYSLREFLRFVGAFQLQHNISGNIAEIGVHHGRFLIALAQFGRQGERCVSIDLFDDQAANIDYSGRGNLEILRQHIDAFAPRDMEYDFIRADSLALTIVERTDIVRHQGPFRLFSVDGGHNAVNVVNDLAFAQDALAPGGVVIVDDMYNRHWPGVTEGVYRFRLLGDCRLLPFMFAYGKLFLTTAGWQRRYFTGLASAHSARPISMWGVDTAVFP